MCITVFLDGIQRGENVDEKGNTRKFLEKNYSSVTTTNMATLSTQQLERNLVPTMAFNNSTDSFTRSRFFNVSPNFVQRR